MHAYLMYRHEHCTSKVLRTEAGKETEDPTGSQKSMNLIAIGKVFTMCN